MSNPKGLILDAFLHSDFMMLHCHKMGELTLGAGGCDSIIDMLLLVPSLDFLLETSQEFCGVYELCFL